MCFWMTPSFSTTQARTNLRQSKLVVTGAVCGEESCVAVESKSIKSTFVLARTTVTVRYLCVEDPDKIKNMFEMCLIFSWYNFFFNPYESSCVRIQYPKQIELRKNNVPRKIQLLLYLESLSYSTQIVFFTTDSFFETNALKGMSQIGCNKAKILLIVTLSRIQSQ